MTKQNSNKFNEFSKAQIQETRNIVISEDTYNDMIVLGQQVTVNEGNGKVIAMFLRGAFYIDKDKLINVRDAINEALEEIEK